MKMVIQAQINNLNLATLNNGMESDVFSILMGILGGGCG